MNKKFIYIIFAAVLIVAVAFYVIQRNIVSKNLDQYIQDNLPDNIELTYDKISTNLISGSVSLDNVFLYIKDRGAKVYLSKFEAKGLSYQKIITSDTLQIEKVSFDNMRVFVDKSQSTPIRKSSRERKNTILKLNELQMELAHLEIKDEHGTLNAEMDATVFSLNNLIIQTAPKQEDDFLQYKLTKIATDSVHLPLGQFQTLSIGHLIIDSTSLDLRDTHLTLKDKGIDVRFNKLGLEGAVLNNLIGRDSLIFENCILSKGTIEIDNSKKQTKATKDSLNRANKFIGIKNLEIKNTDFTFLNKKGKLTLDFANTNALFSDLEILTNPSQDDNAITYNFIQLDADSIRHGMSLHTLTANHIHVLPKEVEIQKLAINPDYSREVFQTKLQEERDMITLSIPMLNIKDYDYSFDDATPFFLADQVTMNTPVLNVYRNKYPDNQTSRKPLYSEMLRKLDLELGIEKINVADADITYEEQKSFKVPSGKIFFKNLNGTIQHLYNKNSQKEKVSIEVNTLFMGHAPTHVIWNFHILNPADQFYFEGKIDNLKAQSLDDFLAANMKAKIDGELQSTNFQFTGADWGAKGQMTMNYEDISVEILNKEHEKKGFWSAIANFFIKRNEKDKDVAQQVIEVERDQKKSFFNLLWLFLKQGLKQNMVKFQKNDTSK
ncbi:DUF748 domain-containing protein [Flavobacteriaceae bacterium Ap0902]|nr:DUF748 domain-containing protein [Flavobacteriaceae bacterium Ap0902]